MFFIQHVWGALRAVLEPLRKGERALIVSSTGLHLKLLGAKGLLGPVVGPVIGTLAFVSRTIPGGRALGQLLMGGALPVASGVRSVGLLCCTPTANVVILVVHVMTEGRRWQLVPCYFAGAYIFDAKEALGPPRAPDPTVSSRA